MLCDSIHWRRNEGDLQLDVSRQIRGNVDIAKGERDVAWHHDNIVVRICDTGRVPDKQLSCSVPS